MATQTPNFNFDLRESADIFNPLSTNANFESLDTILKNLQETGGITTYTTTAAANLLKLSGTPKVNDTVFKFVAAGDANTWTAATGGVINNIVALDGKQVTIKGGNMYVAWVNSANAMVVVAWPAVVDAQTFDGKGPNEWATKAQLDTVNQTAANATQTAQAAQTVANNALQVAESAASYKETVIWENTNVSLDQPDNTTITPTTPIPAKTNYLIFIVCYSTGSPSSKQAFIFPFSPHFVDSAGKENFWFYRDRASNVYRDCAYNISSGTFTIGQGVNGSFGNSDGVQIVQKIIAVEI